LDVADEARAKAAVEEAVKQFGRIGVLVNNYRGTLVGPSNRHRPTLALAEAADVFDPRLRPSEPAPVFAHAEGGYTGSGPQTARKVTRLAQRATTHEGSTFSGSQETLNSLSVSIGKVRVQPLAQLPRSFS